MLRRAGRAEVDADLEEYAAARRPDLVRVGVLLGSAPEHAATVADRTLVRVAREWRDLRGAAAPDDRLLSLLLEERAADTSRRWDSETDPVPALPPALSADLDRLPLPRRAALVWAALGHGPDVDPALQPAVAAAALQVVVPPPTGATPAPRRRAAPVAAAVLTVLGVGLAVSLWPDGATPPAEDPLDRVEVVQRDNPAPLGWYADGRLHLAGFVAPVEDVRAFVEVAGGAVYLDDRGRVVRLSADGERTLLGRADVGAGLVGSSVFGRVAWVTEDGDGLEVADVATGEVVARRTFDVPPPDREPVPPRLVRMSGAELRYTESGREHEWDTAGQTFRSDLQGGRGDLVDEVGNTQLRQVDPGTASIELRYGSPLVARGVGVEISRRQQYVLLRTGEGGSGVRVVSVTTREEVDAGLTEADVVLDARFSDADRVTYLLADRAALPDASGAGRVSSTGPLEVRSCQVRTGVCEVHASGPGAGDSAALLAR